VRGVHRGVRRNGFIVSGEGFLQSTQLLQRGCFPKKRFAAYRPSPDGTREKDDTKADKIAADLSATNANVAAGRKLIYEVTLSEDQGNFKFNKSDLPDEAKGRIDQVVGQLKGQSGKDIYIEIEGHTDNVGGKETNYEIGMKRAEAVKQYLYTQHQIPLHKINVISYGEDKPVAPNNTRAGRAMNRRVVVRVLS